MATFCILEMESHVSPFLIVYFLPLQVVSVGVPTTEEEVGVATAEEEEGVLAFSQAI